MKVIFGLGNPGNKYRDNRHNVGHKVVDSIADRIDLKFKNSFRTLGAVANGRANVNKILLVKPNTYMNNSGACIKRTVKKYGLSLEDILIVYDDVDLDLGKFRIRPKGSCGGHNGMDSIITSLGTNDVNRLRIGIGRPERGEVADYVLSNFSSSDKRILNDIIESAASISLDWADKGLEFSMNSCKEFNHSANS